MAVDALLTILGIGMCSLDITGFVSRGKCFNSDVVCMSSVIDVKHGHVVSIDVVSWLVTRKRVQTWTMA